MNVGFELWEAVAAWSVARVGQALPMITAEGGRTPRGKAGTSQATFVGEYDPMTPKMVATKAPEMARARTPIPGMCPGLMGDDAFHDTGWKGWPFESRYGWAYRERCGYKKPVVYAPYDNPPPPIPWLDSVTVR